MFAEATALLLMIGLNQVLVSSVISLQVANSSAIELVYFINFYDETYLQRAAELADMLVSQAFLNDLISVAANISQELKQVYEAVQLQLPILTLTIGSLGKIASL